MILRPLWPTLLVIVTLSTITNARENATLDDLKQLELRLTPNSIEVLVDSIESLQLSLSRTQAADTNETIEVMLTCSIDDRFRSNESDHQCDSFHLTSGYRYVFHADGSQWQQQNVSFKAVKPGKQQLVAHNLSGSVDARRAFVMINVGRSNVILLISNIVGWVYFVAWSVSFYPQIWQNYRARSVEGLNFDYIALNLTGFFSYTVFNAALYFIGYVQDQFEKNHPHSQIPVELNDVIFGLHAVFATLVTIIQCFVYERGQQRISYAAQGMLAIIWTGYVVLAFLAAFTHWITLLTFLYVFSYVKLGITIVKYIPQAWFNYKRKSTIGWSIGNIFLDSLGGSLSIFQMFLLAYNYDDWIAIFLNFTKFGLGAVSIMFDVLFLLQHYVFFRHAPPSEAARLYVERGDSSVDNSKEDLTKDKAPVNYGAFESDRL